MANQSKSLIARFTNLVANFIPCNCQLCGTENPQMICAACQKQFFGLAKNRCRCCAQILVGNDTRCGRCLSHPPAFQATTVACDYVAPLDQLVLTLKFEHHLAVAPALSLQMARAVKSTNLNKISLPDLLMPVPLSRARLAERGFNQALEIAKPLARILNMEIYPQLLQRVRDTTPQTLLHPDQRHINIRHAFSPNIDYSDKIRGRHIGVVDDVMTTGATLDEIASCLLRHGAAKVSNFVFARTPPH